MGDVAVSVTKQFKFSAAHYLPNDPGMCRNLHGHTYVAEVTATGELDERAMVVHFDELKEAWRRVERQLDHQTLNKSLPYEAQPPTTERVAVWLLGELHRLAPTVTQVAVWEGPSSKATARLVGVT